MHEPMLINEIAHQYPRAEITTAIIHDRAQDRYFLIFGVVELCPEEQPPSTSLGASPHFLVREPVESGSMTLYLRRDFVDIEIALQFFRGIGGQHILPAVPKPCSLVTAGPLASYSGDEPILIPPNLAGCTGLGAMLPMRPTCISVLSKFDATDATRKLINETRLPKVVKGINNHLGIDLSRYPEHLGALHLCFANPLIRRLEQSLSKDGSALLVRCLERSGRSVVGCSIEMSNQWPEVGQGFSLRRELTSSFAVLPMPARPQRLRVRLFDPSGRCIEDEQGTFIAGFSIRTGIVEHEKVTLGLPGEPLHVVKTERVRYEVRPEPPQLTMDQRIKEAARHRAMEDFALAREFNFFEGGPESRNQALSILRELAGKAMHHFDIVDPYLGAPEVLSVIPFVRSAHCQIRLISSRMHLSKRGEDDATLEAKLAATVVQIRERIGGVIDARQIGSRRFCPVHDRLFRVDGAIYVLGCSLNMFGDRTTTIIKAPDPRKLLAKVEEWWTKGRDIDNNLAGPSFKELFGQLWKVPCGAIKETATLFKKIASKVLASFRKGGA